METKSRGRPKGPERVVFKKRVSPQEAELLSLRLSELRSGSGAGVGDQVLLKPKESPIAAASLSGGVGMGGPAVVKVLNEANDDLMAKLEVKKKEVLSLLQSLSDLEEKRAYWEDRFNKAVNATESQMALYWKGRAVKAELRVKELEQ